LRIEFARLWVERGIMMYDYGSLSMMLGA